MNTTKQNTTAAAAAAEVPNLDAMSSDELMQFWQRHQSGRNRAALGLSGRGSKRATADLANYAANKATAMRCRLEGAIGKALIYEQIADRIYNALPAAAKW